MRRIGDGVVEEVGTVKQGPTQVPTQVAGCGPGRYTAKHEQQAPPLQGSRAVQLHPQGEAASHAGNCIHLCRCALMLHISGQNVHVAGGMLRVIACISTCMRCLSAAQALCQ